ncbi:SulP family inorganic anion transporter [Jannaschia sp. 2305UL9-9]|uniref:SulP family inorganic anion transporter n=1 Tax=Jannaschia sp. 2305UL9-9 TaxID=3121638 RepID=UPI003528B5E3
MTLKDHFPILTWGRSYDRGAFGADLLAALIVTIMLIPQSLAYALLAGLPPEAGLYASIVPIILYALFGTSRALAVGPVAVVSLMTASALGDVAQQGTTGYAAAALTLAGMSGLLLLAMGLLRLGRLASFLSHPVVAGFITASGILIAASQLRHILGIDGGGHDLIHIARAMLNNIGDTNGPTVIIGAAALIFLFWVRRGFGPMLHRLGLGRTAVDIMVKAGPVFAVATSTWAVWQFGLQDRGVAIVGAVPQALPPFTLPPVPLELVRQLTLPAILISIIGFVESISVAQTLAAKTRDRIDPNQELLGLGAANIGAAFTGGFPVTGGFSRSVVNFDAGARTPAAGILTAGGLAFAAIALTPLIHFLPKATLAATIIVAVLSLVDLSILRTAWAYAKADFAAVAATILLTLLVGVETGVTAGVAVSLLLHLNRTSRPHIAEVGRVPGTEHFRNILRHEVETQPHVLALRPDESLYFANARVLEDLILDRVTRDRAIRHVILLCSAVNEVDLSALESLESLNERLGDMNVALHLSEVKGPVMDRLKRSHLLETLRGDVHLSHHSAVRALDVPPLPTAA